VLEVHRFGLDPAAAKILIAVTVGMLLSGLIGLEREAHDRPAGLRTHMLVGGASALLVGLGQLVLLRFSDQVRGDLIASDPLRIIGAVITGVSFLGTGTIIRHPEGGVVRGLTTAASLLMAAAIGIAVAVGEVGLAVLLTALVLGVLLGIGALERRFKR
jgi:putative Mg2+ transporter-C (MgtC) family protein